MKLLDAIKAASLKQENISVNELKTPWTDQVTVHNVWQEYPRPQMVRHSYINLNGLWDYAIVDGITEQTPDTWDGHILVPFSPEAPLSGVKRQLIPGQTLCYRRTFSGEHPADLPDGRLLLRFGAVDQRCQVYVNHQKVGDHEGGYLPFSLDITEAIHDGTNTLHVFCQDDSDTSYHTRGKQMLKRGGMFYTAQSGIWQTVWMEWVPSLYIEALRLTPDYDQSQICVTVHTTGSLPAKPTDASAMEAAAMNAGDVGPNTTDSTSVVYRILVTSKGKPIAGLSTESPHFTLVIPDFVPWTPETPYLYDLTLEICDAADPTRVIDRVESYFAMRCVTVEQDAQGIARLCLNHEPYFQHGLLDQGYWPDGLLTAPCDAAYIYDIQTMKDAGFNMLRKHCKLEPLRWYYHCDRLGMLVWQDITNGGSSYDMFHVCYRPTLLPFTADGAYDRAKGTGRTDPASQAEWYHECQATIELLYNCPSLVSWVVFNEGWGQFDTEKATAFAKALDSTRTFDQASGWFDHQGGDMKSVHNYFRKLVCPPTNTASQDGDRSTAACATMASVDTDPTSAHAAPPSANRCGLRAAVISEYGGLALPLPGHITTDQVYGYKNLKSMKEFQSRFQAMMKHILSLEADGLSAAVYTQVSDIEDEVNGLLTYDRKVNKVTAD